MGNQQGVDKFVLEAGERAPADFQSEYPPSLCGKLANEKESGPVGRTACIAATQAGHLSTLKYLKANGAHVDLPNNAGATCLMIASDKGDVALVKFFVEDCKSDVNARDDHGHGPLWNAAHAGHTDIVQYLHKHGGDINAKDKRLYSALVMAARDGHVETCRYMISARADVKAKTEFGETALIMAARYGRLDVIKLFVGNGDNLNMRSDSDWYSALMEAAEAGSLEVVKFLVENGANPSAKNKFDKNALQIARQNHHTHIAEYLAPLVTEDDPVSGSQREHSHSHSHPLSSGSPDSSPRLHERKKGATDAQ